MSLESYWRFALALVAVVALIALCAWIARRLGLGGGFVTGSGKRRLAIIEALPLDGKRRLVLLKRDGVEHLLLLGLHNDLVIERGVGGDFSGLVQEEKP
ncbi:MAG TPA: flagellar biosynthetic protein FliO [Stellaceae bacterium]|nr:flagellar biosynthetic protein FliO [Stellaceae bacterium]